MPSNFIKFKNILSNKSTNFILEAHNPISAKIVEETGFVGIWASGLTLSASYALRDANELTMTQVLNIVDAMQDQVNVPIVLDGDTGYGNFNNFRILVKQLCKSNIAAVCIEDKLFPKNNSFSDRAQELEKVNIFCNKIKAGKDTQLNNDFSIIARTEALICGLSVEAAIERCEQYYSAGADAILIHSKKSDGKEIMQFLDLWGNNCPVIIIPTMYYSVLTQEFIDRKVSIIIWANHLLRAAIFAMQHVSRYIKKYQSTAALEQKIASIYEIFRLCNDSELKNAEEKYLSRK